MYLSYQVLNTIRIRLSLSQLLDSKKKGSQWYLLTQKEKKGKTIELVINGNQPCLFFAKAIRIFPFPLYYLSIQIYTSRRNGKKKKIQLHTRYIINNKNC